MNLSLDEIYEMTIYSLDNTPNDWTHNDHYHKFKGNVGIPYRVWNPEIGVDIWLANSFLYCNIQIFGSREADIYKERQTELPSLGLRRKWILYRKSMKLFKRKTKWDIPLSTKTDRDVKLDKLLK